MTLQSHSWVYIQRKTLSERIHAPQHCLQAKTRKQTKCPSIKEWIKKMWYLYTMEYYSATKKNETMPFVVRWMELESVIQSEEIGRAHV